MQPKIKERCLYSYLSPPKPPEPPSPPSPPSVLSATSTPEKSTYPKKRILYLEIFGEDLVPLLYLQSTTNPEEQIFIMELLTYQKTFASLSKDDLMLLDKLTPKAIDFLTAPRSPLQSVPLNRAKQKTREPEELEEWEDVEETADFSNAFDWLNT